MHRYKVSATIHKVGNPPVKWEFYSPVKMTQKQCEAMFYKPKEAGLSHGESVRLEAFCCEKMEKNLI
ncbi:DUF1187 family protein [Salmonella enterica subsp. enterica serovar Florida]|nr:DUF1187 family protein [Salmonella enterica subsp. enterica serovar Florida]